MYIFDSIGAVISNCVIPPFIIALSIGVLSLILYSLEAFILLKRHRRYNTAFFRLFIARFILNVLGHFNSFICVRLGRVGVFLDFFEMLPAKLLAFSFFFYFYTFHAENIATMFILVNRLSVVAMPMTQVKLWKYLLPVSILCIFVLPLFFTAQNLTYEFYIRHTFGSKTKFTLDFRRNEGEQYLNSPYIAAISATLFCIICGVINVAIVILYQKMKQMVISLQQKNVQSTESKLTIYAVITFLSHTLMAIFMILIFIAGGDISRDILFFSTFNQLPWLNDLGTIAIPAWTLLWASSAVRREVVTIVGLKKPSTESVFERVNKSSYQCK